MLPGFRQGADPPGVVAPGPRELVEEARNRAKISLRCGHPPGARAGRGLGLMVGEGRSSAIPWLLIARQPDFAKLGARSRSTRAARWCARLVGMPLDDVLTMQGQLDQLLGSCDVVDDRAPEAVVEVLVDLPAVAQPAGGRGPSRHGARRALSRRCRRPRALGRRGWSRIHRQAAYRTARERRHRCGLHRHARRCPFLGSASPERTRRCTSVSRCQGGSRLYADVVKRVPPELHPTPRARGRPEGGRRVAARGHDAGGTRQRRARVSAASRARRSCARPDAATCGVG